MVVYIDLLFIDNFCADAALLYCAVRTVKGRAKLWRIGIVAFFGAMLGTGYAVFCLYYTLPGFVGFLVKYGVLALLPLPAATFKRKRTYALCSLAFAGYMFAFAGILTALFAQGEIQQGGELSYNVQTLPSGVLVLACVVLAFGGARFAKFVRTRKKLAALLFDCRLTLRGKCVSARAFADTGNRLKDGRGRGVVIAERAVALSLLADGLFSVSTPCEKIEVRTVNGKSFLTAFQIDVLKIYYGGRANILRDVTVAISEQSFAGEYTLILPASFTKEEDFSDSEVKDAEQDPCIPAPVDAQDEDAGKRT